jgi:DNA-binding Lrp family transcriptional regulator
MMLDKIDLKILRYLENHGFYWPELKKEFTLEEEELKSRFKKLRDQEIICGLKPVIFIPKYLGGEWIFGCVFAYTKEITRAIDEITNRLVFATEIWINYNIPQDYGYNLTLLFYSRNFSEETKFIKEIKEILLLESPRIIKYSFPVPRVLDTDEQKGLRAILELPEGSIKEWAEYCNVNQLWLETKIAPLIKTKTNPQGIIQILPEINYYKIENFTHCHFFVECRADADFILEELKLSGFQQILPLPIKNKNILQLENDLWGFDDFFKKVDHLKSFRELILKGIVLAYQKIIIDKGSRSLFEK